jgi:integrase
MPLLTNKFARTAAPDRIYFDSTAGAPRGFALRVSKRGARSWIFGYRSKVTGQQRRMVIGDVGAWPVSEARKRAAELRRQVDLGGDPQGERAEQRAAPTVTELWDRFVVEALPSRAERTQGEYASLARDYMLPAFGRLKVAAITRADVEKLHREITRAGKARRANATRSLVSVVFAQAIEWGLRDDNPAAHIKPNVEHQRERFLSVDEVGRLMSEIEHRQQRGGHWVDSGDKIKLAVFTGARRGELLAMTWSQIIDLDSAAATWVLPSQSTKEGKRTGKIKRLPLSPGAVEILQRRRDEYQASGIVRLRDDIVFRRGNSKAGQNELEADWRVFRAAAAIENCRFHDLRHSFASLAVAEGLSLHIVAKLLGHSRTATTERYAHLADQPLRAATELVDRKVRRRGAR